MEIAHGGHGGSHGSGHGGVHGFRHAPHIGHRYHSAGSWNWNDTLTVIVVVFIVALICYLVYRKFTKRKD